MVIEVGVWQATNAAAAAKTALGASTALLPRMVGIVRQVRG
jgi:hypothetical protein